MAKNQNEYTSVLLEIVEDFRAMREQAFKAKPIPFGMEQVSKSTFLERFQALSKEDRQRTLDDPDQRDQIIKLLRDME